MVNIQLDNEPEISMMAVIMTTSTAATVTTTMSQQKLAVQNTHERAPLTN